LIRGPGRNEAGPCFFCRLPDRAGLVGSRHDPVPGSLKRDAPGEINPTMALIKKSAAKPQLEQKEREAIVDLLHLCLYADAHIAANESDLLAEVVDYIGWETQSSFGSYEARSIASARSAKGTPEDRKDFVAAAAARLQSAPARAIALDLCKQLFSADGATAEKEDALLAEIRSALK
jgi:uncharacterized tellurite resistance protein B-like protein